VEKKPGTANKMTSLFCGENFRSIGLDMRHCAAPSLLSWSGGERRRGLPTLSRERLRLRITTTKKELPKRVTHESATLDA